MKIELYAAYNDGQDGSHIIWLFNTKEEALERLNRTEEELQDGNIYDDGAMELLTLEFNEFGKLINKPSISIE